MSINSQKKNPELLLSPIVTKIILFLGFIGSAFISQYATSFNQVAFLWLPSGFALAGAIFFGRRFFAWIFLSSFFWNLYFFNSILDTLNYSFVATSAIIGFGTALQALFGAYLIKKYSFNLLLENSYKGILRYLFYAGFLTCLISPIFGVTSLSFINHNWDFSTYINNIRIWWLGDSFGAIVLTLPLLALLTKKYKIGKEKFVFHKLLPLLLILFISIIVYIGQFSKKQYRAEIEYRLEKELNKFSESLREQNAKNNMALVAIESYVKPGLLESSTQFEIFSENILSETPSLGAISWNPIVHQKELSKFITKTRTQGGIPDFNVTGKPLNNDDPYVIVTFIEPISKNKKAQGFNVFSNKERKEAMLQAKNKKENVSTNLLKLVQDSVNNSFLVFHPIFKYHSEDSLLGYAVGIFKADTLLKTAYKKSNISNNILVKVFEDSSTHEFWKNTSQSEKLFISSLQQSLHFKISKKTWRIEIHPSLVYVEATSGKIRMLFQIFIVVISSILALFIWYFSNQQILEIQRKRKEQEMLDDTMSLISETAHISYSRLSSNRMNTDESKIEKANNILKSVNSLFLSLIESADNIIIYAVDLNYNYLTYNLAHEKEMKNSFGCQINVEKSIFDFIKNKETQENLKKSYNRVFAGESFVKTENINSEDNITWYQTTYNPIYDTNKNIIGLTCFKVDVSEKLKFIKLITEAKNVSESTNKKLIATQEELEKTNQELLLTDKTKNKLFSIISHDLRSPFNGIIGFSQYLSKNYSTMTEDVLGKHLGTLEKSATQAYELLGNLLDWSRNQIGQFAFNRDYISLEGTIEQVINHLESSALNKEITIIYNRIDENMIYADANQFMTILRNLIQNGIKFTERNGSITIETKKTDKHFEISVKDSGIGIPEDIRDKMFDLNYINSEFGTEGESGTGLGLQLCTGFVHNHGGKIWVESEEGKGAKFIFTIPFK